jgi:hypothetical protein
MLGHNSSSHMFLLAHSSCEQSTVEDRNIAAVLFFEVWGLADVYQLPPPCHLHTLEEGIKSRQ